MIATRLLDATPVLDDWWLIRLPWDNTPPAPGEWLWLEIDGQRRQLPIRDSHAREQWVAGLLPGAIIPQTLRPGTAVSISALQGNPVQLPSNKRLLIVGDELGIGPALGLAERYASQTRLVIVGGRYGLPAKIVPSRFLIPAVKDSAIAGVGTLEAMNIPSRIALTTERPGVFAGQPMDLLQQYLKNTRTASCETLEIIVFGPTGEWTEFDGSSPGAVSSSP